MLANKIDADSTQWRVSLEEGREFASSIGPYAQFVPLSVKSGENCRKADVEELIRRILFRRLEKPPFREERVRRLRKRRYRLAESLHQPLNCIEDSLLYQY